MRAYQSGRFHEVGEPESSKIGMSGSPIFTEEEIKALDEVTALYEAGYGKSNVLSQTESAQVVKEPAYQSILSGRCNGTNKPL